MQDSTKDKMKVIFAAQLAAANNNSKPAAVKPPAPKPAPIAAKPQPQQPTPPVVVATSKPEPLKIGDSVKYKGATITATVLNVEYNCPLPFAYIEWTDRKRECAYLDAIEICQPEPKPQNLCAPVTFGIIAPQPQKQAKIELSTMTFADILPEAAAPQNAPNKPPHGLNLIQYTGKSIAVLTAEKPEPGTIEKLRNLNGSFNRYLNVNGIRVAGWIFPKWKEKEVKEVFSL